MRTVKINYYPEGLSVSKEVSQAILNPIYESMESGKSEIRNQAGTAKEQIKNGFMTMVQGILSLWA